MEFRERMAMRRLAREITREQIEFDPTASAEVIEGRVLAEIKETLGRDDIDWDSVLNMIKTILKVLAIFL